MLENVGRRIFLVVLFLAIALGALLLRDKPFRMGLDLQGGTRLVYRFDFQQAIQDGSISANESQSDILAQQIEIIYNRVDPYGVIEPLIRREGSDRLVIEMPGAVELQGKEAKAPLLEAIEADKSVRLLKLGGTTLQQEDFPANGGEIALGNETIRYEQRVGDTLRGCERGYLSTGVVRHEANSEVRLVSDDYIRIAIENLGQLEFSILARESDFQSAVDGTDLQSERARLETWAKAHPGARIKDFNSVPRAEGGPHPKIRWLPMKLADNLDPELSPELQRAQPLLVFAGDQQFKGQDLASISRTTDQFGYPAVGFEFKPEKRVAFGDFTESYINRNMAIMLNDVIETAPNINSKLPGSGIIMGKYKAEEVGALVTVLRSGSLRLKPILEHKERVGPTLGLDSIRRNLWSGVLSFLVVSAFMIAYYRILGVFSTVALLVNLVLLMGGMSFVDATLTLPGIGGIILTVGMAVDANILIFDRIREEADRGIHVKQAAKEGFDRAFSAIFDSNITTLLSGLILYNVGSGPVRGFAVTLSIGILTSLFSQLVVTRLLVHLALARGLKEFKMGTWLVNANYRFLAYAKVCFTGSILVIAAGLGLFMLLPNVDKFGIEFLGGATMQLRTQEPQTLADVRRQVQSIEGVLSESEVKPVGRALEGDRYQSFRITSKTDPDKQGEQGGDAGAAFESVIRDRLAPILAKAPVEILELQPNLFTRLRLHFEEAHSIADLSAKLESVGLSAVSLNAVGELENWYEATGTLLSPLSSADLQASVQKEFSGTTDANGVRYALASPVSESSVVGKQVVGELRDKAILAVLLSMFVIVLYIRVRFAEYSYGLAAVAALVHDVAITICGLAVAIKFDFIEAEISLSMIAVFLTIIGYSINDTIVIFDRVRENRIKLQKPLAEVLDISINQTLSRTILTSLTVFISITLMLLFNLGSGNVLEGFTYAMLVGMISGVYSTVYIASPVLLWLENRSAAKALREAAETQQATTA